MTGHYHLCPIQPKRLSVGQYVGQIIQGTLKAWCLAHQPILMYSPTEIFGLNRGRAAAKSTEFNPRNLEHVWYPFWTRAASQIACQVDLERCTVAPQFPLWRIWTRDDTNLGHIKMLEDSDDDQAMDFEFDGASSDAELQEDELLDSEGNTTLSSINETFNIKTRSRITDFALVQ